MPILPEDSPLRQWMKKRPILGVIITRLEETPAEKDVIDKFIEGLASAIGVSPDVIDKNRVATWMRDWYKTGEIEIDGQRAFRLGHEIALIIVDALSASVKAAEEREVEVEEAKPETPEFKPERRRTTRISIT